MTTLNMTLLDMTPLDMTSRLVEQAIARLCHDLSGLIGTVGNALDLLAEEVTGNEVLAFADTASRVLTQRLRLMRTAWGPEIPAMTKTSFRVLIEEPLQSRRVTLDMTHLADNRVFSPAAGRLQLNIILLAADCMPRGGTITLYGQPDGVLTGIESPPNMPPAAWPTELSDCINDPSAVLASLGSPRPVQLLLTVMLAASRNLPLSIVAIAESGRPGLRWTQVDPDQP